MHINLKKYLNSIKAQESNGCYCGLSRQGALQLIELILECKGGKIEIDNGNCANCSDDEKCSWKVTRNECDPDIFGNFATIPGSCMVRMNPLGV